MSLFGLGLIPEQNCCLCGKSVGPEPDCVDMMTGLPVHVECIGRGNVEEFDGC